jgi:hypothetical protein
MNDRTEHCSPSGRYKLVVESVPTKPGCWNYSRGRVYRAQACECVGEPIATVDRNYAAFPFLFVEDHPRGDFLVCGADYQGQTVIELATGKRVDHLPPEAEKGVAFCWVRARYDVIPRMLVVEGCFWACPYEFRFYDFADPMAGWPEIVLDKYVDADDRQPEVRADGVVTCFESDPPADDDEERTDHRPVAVQLTFRREGLRLVLANEWVSKAEQARRAARAESERKFEEWKANFKATDPLYQVYLQRLQDPRLSPETHEGIGVTHAWWCPDFTKQERRWCRRIRQGPGAGKGWTVDLSWAVETGPIKLDIFKDGKHVEDKFFDHSVAGMHAAFDHAEGLK